MRNRHAGMQRGSISDAQVFQGYLLNKVCLKQILEMPFLRKVRLMPAIGQEGRLDQRHHTAPRPPRTASEHRHPHTAPPP